MCGRRRGVNPIVSNGSTTFVMLSTFSTPGIFASASVTRAIFCDRRGREHVVGADADHPEVVAPEGRADGVVVLHLRVARGQHALDRVLDPDTGSVEPQATVTATLTTTTASA
jgi:hypothetical protein